MQTIISYIEDKRKEYELHPFFTQLLGNYDIPGERRLAWVPSVIPFIMSYADLNQCVFRKTEAGSFEDRFEAMLNSHSYEEDFHWQWLLNDLDRLRADPKLSLSDATRILWSSEFRHSRILSLELAAQALHSPSYVVFAMMEAIEATSIVLFKNCVGIVLQNGDECEFFGTKHYIAESSHAIHSADKGNPDFPDLDEHQRQIARQAVDRVFSLFTDWIDSLLRYPLENDGHTVAYKKILSQSKRMLPLMDR